MLSVEIDVLDLLTYYGVGSSMSGATAEPVPS